MSDVCIKLMIIRHAEKPDKQAGITGISATGLADPDELTVRGWQRAGALVRFFNPRRPESLATGIDVPGAIFATPPGDDSPSRRPLHTVTLLAADLGLKVRQDFALHQERELVAAALAAAPAVLVCWHHERIARLLAPLGLDSGVWPDPVFDRVLVADRAASGWTLSTVPQHLLPGDA